MIFVRKYPDNVFESIRGKGFTIKDTLDPYYFLGGYFERVKEPKTNNKIMTWGSNTYVKCMMDNFKNTFGFDTSQQHSDMPPEYKPGLDTTELFTGTEKSQYWQVHQ